MEKRDPYNHKARWEAWKSESEEFIAGVSEHNFKLIKSFLFDMEIGRNVSPVARKGERSCCRLLALKSRLVFFATQLKDMNFEDMTSDYILKFFYDMRNGKILRQNGQPYIGVSSYVKDFKSFWSWMIRTGRAIEDITRDIRRSDGRKPAWVYLTEEQFKMLANAATADYRALLWLMYDTGMRVTEGYSIRVGDFSENFTKLNIRKEYAKTFGRTVKLKLSCSFIREFVKFHHLKDEDFIFIKTPAAFNKYLRSLAQNMFGDSVSPARKQYSHMRLYDIRHNASCYWLSRYPTTTGLMYRMGWSEEKEVRYYSEFLGQADNIDDEDMVTTEEKTKYEKRIAALESDRQNTKELMTQLVSRISELQRHMSLQGVNSCHI